MADDDKESKTEDATAKRLSKLRSEGRIVKSADLQSAFIVVTCVLTLWTISSRIRTEVLGFTHRMFRFEDLGDPQGALFAFFPAFNAIVAPVLVVAAVVAIGLGLIQTKALFSLKVMEFRLANMNPIGRLKTIFPSKDSALEVLKNLVRLIAIGFVVYSVIADELPYFVTLPAVEPVAAGARVGGAAVKVIIWATVAFVAIGAWDYFRQWKKFRDDTKMSKQEVKDEHKQTEQDPQVKNEIRRKQMQFGKRRMIANVKKSTVIVANPTHISVALRYKPEEGDFAPIMMAKGVDHFALRLRTEARKYGIPIVENRPLARALYQTGKVYQPIPVALYKAAAEIIAHVLRLRRGAA